VLVHICCSVDSHYFLQRMQEEYPKETLVGFFYDPNIHPYSEYKLRLLDVEYSCKKLGIELIEGPYALEEWLKLVKGLENEPEKGDRCTVCFDNRLETSVKKAIELGHDKFTTTLLISPKKSQDKLEIIGKNLSTLYDCEFGLNAQREQQNKLTDELIYPIGQQIQPESIEERLELYTKRDQLEECNIIKQRFLNYRLLSAKVILNKEVIPSYFLFYSTLKGKKSIGRVEKTIDTIGYFNRDEIKIISLKTFNELSKRSYKTVLELIYNPLLFEEELSVRAKITQNNHFDLSTIIVLEELIQTKLSIFLDYKTYDQNLLLLHLYYSLVTIFLHILNRVQNDKKTSPIHDLYHHLLP